MKSITITVALLICLYTTSAQTAASLQEGNSYLKLAETSISKKDFISARKYSESAINEFKQGPPVKLADSYVMLSKCYEPFDSGITKIITLNQKASELYRSEKEFKLQADCFRKWGEMLMYLGKLEEGMVKLKESLHIYDSIQYNAVQEVYSLIGINYTQQGNFEKGLDFGLQAVKRAESLHDSSNATALIYNYIAVTYEKLGMLVQADDYMKKAFSIAINEKDIPFIYMLAANIGHLSLKLSRPLETISYLNTILKKYPGADDDFSQLQIHSNLLHAHLLLRDYRSASESVSKLLALTSKFPKDDPNLIVVYPFISRYYIETNQLDKATYWLKELQTICETSHLTGDLRTTEFLWFRLDSAKGDYLSAIQHYKSYKSWSDTLLNEAKAKEIAQLQLKYESDQKDERIDLLTQQDQLQKTKLVQARQLKNLTLGGVALLLIVLALLYNRYRIKQRSNRKLQEQQNEINKKNLSLQKLVDEKEWLVKEIHHRVKNNFHIVTSLLGTQSKYLKSEEAIQAINESQHRIQAMSLIHQKLYQSGNLSAVNMSDYVYELVDYLKDSFNLPGNIRFNLQVEAVQLDLSHCIPLGLIMNEAITNAIKYAFAREQEGMITIQFKKVPANQYLLTISDNGKGLPPGFSFENPRTMGIKLMKGLTDDIDGTFSIKTNQGTHINISFFEAPDASHGTIQSNPELCKSYEGENSYS